MISSRDAVLRRSLLMAQAPVRGPKAVGDVAVSQKRDSNSFLRGERADLFSPFNPALPR